MKVICDLHVHSRHSRATSKNLDFQNLEKWARIKGINLLGTGDFQHPLHRKAIAEELREDDKGILWSGTGFPFLWQTEISLMFSQRGKRRAVHLVVLAPNSKTADRIIGYLGGKGRLDYDGRPIFGISGRDFIHDLKQIDERIEVIPAHAFTPWFGLFGSDSGFDSIEECFEDMRENIYAIESGMSADPAMIWRLKEEVNVVSFSDAHSFWPFRLGREATIFDLKELSYENLINAIRNGKGIIATIETPPEYGKYHWDGHRNCNFSCNPAETKKLKKTCPICGKGLTIGVESRIVEISKEGEGYRPPGAKPFFRLLPLHELIAFGIGSRMESKKVWGIYNRIISIFGNEFKVLFEVSKEEIVEKNFDEPLANLILLNREGRIDVKPGFDGQYGEILAGKGRKSSSQKGLGDFF